MKSYLEAVQESSCIRSSHDGASDVFQSAVSMVFSSTTFLFFFLPLVLAGYWLFRGRGKNYFLLFASLLFFYWSQPKYFWIILASIAINYIAALIVERLDGRERRATLIIAIAANLGMLFYFKYFDFVIASINAALHTSFDVIGIALPIGISFFSFQGMSYVIDVHRGTVTAQRNLAKLALYISLFPQLVAGPIVRYADIAAEIDRRSVGVADFREGAERC